MCPLALRSLLAKPGKGIKARGWDVARIEHRREIASVAHGHGALREVVWV